MGRSTKVMEDELIWLQRGALARSTAVNYVKTLRHFFQWAMEEQGADSTWTLLDRFECTRSRIIWIGSRYLRI